MDSSKTVETDHNQALLSTWVDEHADALFRFAMRRVRDRHAVDDLLQETYLAALRSQSSYRGEASVRTWLISILRLKIIDHYRRCARTKKHESKQAEKLEPVSVPGNADWDYAPANTLENEEFWSAFHSCVDKLPEILARAYLLRELEECSPKQVCEILNISNKNLAVRIFRARTLLRNCLDQNWFTPK